MSRVFFLIFGGISYLIFLATFLYTIGFVTNLYVPKTIDGKAEVPLMNALLNNLVLLGIFALQHSGMAREGFKKWWVQIIPDPIERSTYVLFSSLAMILLFWKWEPMGGIVWNISSPFISGLLIAVCLLGFTMVLASSFMINHFDLFGLRQAWFYFRKKDYVPPVLITSQLYSHVRHPLFLGFIIGAWATPVMTATHLIFALIITAYVLVGIMLEEKDLVKRHGDIYLRYREKIPMLIPNFWKKQTTPKDSIPLNDQVVQGSYPDQY